MKFFSDIMF